MPRRRGALRSTPALLDELDVPSELDIVSAHRTPENLHDYAISAEARGLKVIIAGAGGAAHPPGMAAAVRVLPVIGVPIGITRLEGMDALLSIVQMPTGVPVARVAIDNAANAAILAAQMTATGEPELRERLREYKLGLRDKVLQKSLAVKREFPG